MQWGWKIKGEARELTGKFPENEEWSGNDKKCTTCGQDCPTSKKYNDEYKKGRALMDSNYETRSMFHIYACRANLTDEDIEQHRQMWMSNQVNYSAEFGDLKNQLARNPTKDEVISSLLAQKSYYPLSMFRKKSNSKMHVRTNEGEIISVAEMLRRDDVEKIKISKQDVVNMMDALTAFSHAYDKGFKELAETLAPYWDQLKEAQSKLANKLPHQKQDEDEETVS